MHFVIVESEQAVRARNEQIKHENAQLREEVNRLRALVGEPQLEEQPIHVSAVEPVRSFTAGECKVTIARKGPPVLNPMAAGRPVAAAAQPMAAGAVAPQPVLSFQMQQGQGQAQAQAGGGDFAQPRVVITADPAARRAPIVPPGRPRAPVAAPAAVARPMSSTDELEIDEASLRFGLLELR